jgi:alanine racemase
LRNKINNKLKILFKDIASVVDGEFHVYDPEMRVEAVSIDTRTPVLNNHTLFVAINGEHFNAHRFIQTAYEKGIRMFIVQETEQLNQLNDVNYIVVKNSVVALQQFARYYRSLFTIPVIGITGSNGKTIVKEWLYQLLQKHEKIAVSPRSFNSQIGVPLSIFQINEESTLAIFEAGISTVNEMQLLANIIQPTIGILTNIGHAHDAGFNSLQQKFDEKKLLFKNAAVVITSAELVEEYVTDESVVFFTWGGKTEANVYLKNVITGSDSTRLTIQFDEDTFDISIPFIDKASIENTMHCISLLLYLKYPPHEIQEKLLQLRSVPMRMTLKKLSNDALLIDDTYSADIGSLKIALDYLAGFDQTKIKTLVLSDFDQTGRTGQQWLKEVFDILNHYRFQRLIGIGKEWYLNRASLPVNHFENLQVFEEVSDAIRYLRNNIQPKELILLKGARNYSLERVVKSLEFQSHDTRIEVMIPHLIENVQYFKKHLMPGVKCMGMVKAFSYGTGAYEIAEVLVRQGIDYLTVAYLDEGVELRQKGIQLPIMVMNVESHSFERLIEYNLEPVVYSLNIWSKLLSYLEENKIQEYPVHIELETGMNRLGLQQKEIEQLLPQLVHPAIKIQSVFSHLAGSEDPIHDNYTLEQFAKYQKIVGLISQVIEYRFLKHILNTNGILRHPSLQLDMVRLGIGMYGLAVTPVFRKDLKTVVSLITTIAQIKEVEAGTTISYGRKGMVNTKRTIATLRIGYADGYPRTLGNGVGKVWINGYFAAIIGTICMDMLMVDITEIPNVQEGDEAELWGENVSLEELSAISGTIPYEILTGISNRVKRVYITG